MEKLNEKCWEKEQSQLMYCQFTTQGIFDNLKWTFQIWEDSDCEENFIIWIQLIHTSQMVQINMKPCEIQKTESQKGMCHFLPNYSFWLLTFSIEPKGKMTKLLE